jgi:hypothetical protein
MRGATIRGPRREGAATLLLGEMTDGQRIELLASAAYAACTPPAVPELAELSVLTLRASVEHACRTPATFGWDRKAAAHAEIFNVLADLAADPAASAVLSSGTGFVYDLLVAAGPAADGMTTHSRERFLSCLRVAGWDDAALEMELHLRALHFMWRLANPVRAARLPDRVPGQPVRRTTGSYG